MNDYLALYAIGFAAVYLVCGFCTTFSRRAAALLGPQVCGTNTARFALLPGMLLLWPIALLRSRHTATTAPRMASPTRSRCLLQGLCILSLPCLVPLSLASPMRAMFRPVSHTMAPLSILRELPWIQKGGSYGSALSSIPGKVYLGRDVSRRQGLLFRFNPGASYTPTALYWSGNPDKNSGFPVDATYLGMISGPEDCWIEIDAREMRNTGQWIVYSPFFRTIDSHTFSEDRNSN